MPEASVAIGVDIGGSSTKMGVVTQDGKILFQAEQPTPPHLSGDLIMESLLGRLNGLVAWTKENNLSPRGIGVGVCGYLTPSGEEADYINLHALDHFPIARYFREQFGLPVVLDNDMNCSVLGEFLFGGGKGVNRLMDLAVGTGIGLSVMLDRVVFRQSVGTTGNPGHIIVAPDGPICVAGCRGCLESLASAGPIARRAEDLARSQRSTLLSEMLAEKGSLTPEDLFHAAEEGDVPAQETWVEIGNWLGRGLASWVEIFSPEVVIVGGGIAQAGQWLINPIEREMRRTGEPYFTRMVREVKQSQLGRVAAMMGAASFYLYPTYAPNWKV